MAEVDDTLWEEVRAVAYRTLRGRGLDHADADDAAQETMFDLAEAIRRGEPLRNPAGWAAVVARRRATDLVRADRVRKGLPARQDAEEREAERAAQEDAGLEAPGTPRAERGDAVAPLDDGWSPPDDSTPSSREHTSGAGRDLSARRAVDQFIVGGVPTSAVVIRREQLDRLVAALDERNLQLAWLTSEGLTQAEIGEVLGMEREAVKKALQRMRASLESRAGELGIDLAFDDHQRIY